MKKYFFAIVVLFLLANTSVLSAQSYEFLQLTSIESVVPAGLGRSRLVTTKPNGEVNEVKLKNFFSAVGINFGNVRANDKDIAQEISRLSALGYELTDVTTGVYSNDKSTGIFITRYLFKREKQ